MAVEKPHMPTAAERINVMIEEARAFAFTEPAKSLQKIDEAILDAEKENLNGSLAKALETKGTLSINMQKTSDAQQLYKRAAGIWKSEGNEKELVHTLNSLAIAHMLQCDWVESELLLKECLERSKELRDENLHAVTLSNFANFYIRQNDFEKAVAHSVEAIKLLQKLNQYERLVPAVINLGVVYGFLKDDDKALEIYESILPVLDKCADKNNVVNLYVNLGELYVRRNETDKALGLLLNAHDLARQYQYQRGVAYTASTLGNIYAQKKETATAYKYLMQAQTLLEELNDNFVLPQLYLDTAKLLLDTNEAERAIPHLQLALTVSEKNNLDYLQMETCVKFAEAYQQIKNYEQAFFYLNKTVALREKIFTEEKAKSIAELQTKYEVEQKNREAIELKAEIADYHLKLLRSQMNPHFIFNAINSINNFILSKETQQASNYLLRFSQLMRLILDNSSQQFISLKKETEFLKNYLLLESIRFEIPFDFEIILSDDVEEENTLIPPMILQPYVENAIWHGLAHKNTKGKITISISQQSEDLLLCVVEDNGVGRARAEALKDKTTKHVSKGLSLTLERLKQLGNAKDAQAVVVEDLYQNKQATGTRVCLTIPAKNYF